MESIRIAGRLRSVIVCCLLLSQPVTASDHAEWEQLTRDVETRLIQLDELIGEANGKGVCTDFASVSRQTIFAFQTAAKHDRENVERVRSIFQTFNHYSKTDPAEADRLALNELKACLDVADHAIAKLRQQLAGTITLSVPPDFSKGQLKLSSGYYRLDGRTVFPSSLVWMPKEEGYMQAFGRLGEAYYTLGNLAENGAVNERSLKRNVELLGNQCKLNAAPLVFFLGHAPAGWMKRQHPEITQGARHFTQYDIDNPLIRNWIKTLCEGVLPGLGQACGDRPQAHLLANEPHFATRKGGWLAKNGVSEHTMRKYRQWIAAKYQSVESLNAVYGTSHEHLDQVTVDLPIDPALRGGPIWYDWCPRSVSS
jgi:beta-galactosidase